MHQGTTIDDGHVININIGIDALSTSCQRTSSDDNFFIGAFADKSREECSSEKLVDDFLKKGHLSQS